MRLIQGADGVRGRAGGAAHGTFAFGSLPGRSNVTPGKYRIAGRYDERGGSLRMEPAGWIDQPPGYASSGFALTYVRRAQWLSGRIEWKSCSPSILRKAPGDRMESVVPGAACAT